MSDPTPDNPQDPDNAAADGADGMAGYLDLFIDETEEELDAVASALVELERDSQNAPLLNEVFRLVHSMKGSAGMMGLVTVSELAHRWEDLLDRVRSNEAPLRREHVDVMLRCVDAFRAFVHRLREAGALRDAAAEETRGLSEELVALLLPGGAARDAADRADPAAAPAATTLYASMKLAVRFDDRLQLPDLKAKLIVSRLSGLAEIVSVDPDPDDAEAIEASLRVTIAMLTQRSEEEIRAAADLEGVASLDFLPVSGDQTLAFSRAGQLASVAEQPHEDDAAISIVVAPGETAPATDEAPPVDEPTPPEPATADTQPRQVAETVRVDIGRLDTLMNLTGELIVHRERFEELTRDRSSPRKDEQACRRLVEIADRMEASPDLGEESEWLRDCAARWSEGARRRAKVTEAVDQLSRLSDNLQQSVLGTRMVPLAPLFNRFKRVVRDLARDRKRQVRLTIRGENTELDKRMIDELSDPLIHLVRNAIDHGLEPPSERRRAGKDPTGVIALEATHRGNSVSITIRDDGRGIDLGRVRSRIVDRGLASAEAVAAMSEGQALAFIWRPGFSTAEEVTDISGRGVGMDIVRSRIGDLSGAIDIDTTPGAGTIFTIRLPLTLAIIPSLLVKIGETTFSIPMDEVNEIFEAPDHSIVSVRGRRAVDIRDRIVPIVSLEEAFGGTPSRSGGRAAGRSDGHTLVVLAAGESPAALQIDRPLGVSALVIKSLSDNFRPVPGLSGASILGDGGISLMLDTTAVLHMAKQSA